MSVFLPDRKGFGRRGLPVGSMTCMDSQGQSGVRKKKHGGILLLQSMRVGKGNPLPAASFADIHCPLRERFVKMHIQGCWLTQGNAHLNNFVRNKSKNDKAMP